MPATDTLLIRNGRVVDPSRNLDASADLLIKSGKVAKIGKDLNAPGADVLDAKGCIVAPGFMDLHVHLREPGYEQKETIATGLAAAVAGGFTSVCCMANTKPVNDNKSVTKFMLKEARRVGLANLFPIASVTKGMDGKELTEMATLLKAGAVAFSDDGLPVSSPSLMRHALTYAGQLGAPVINHCEDLDMAGDGVMHEGHVSCCLGFSGKPSLSESLMVARDLMLLEEYGGHLHVAHISTAKAVELVRAAKKRGLRVTAEAAPHHFTLTDEAVKSFDTSTKMNPPLRPDADRKAVLKGLADGTIDCIATDHAPHTYEEKLNDYVLAPNGIIGLETAVPLAVDRLLKGKVVTLKRLVDLFACGPARVLGMKHKGTLKPGADGDVTVFSTTAKTVVNAAASRSKARNTPFGGMELTGAVVATVVAGRVVYRK